MVEGSEATRLTQLLPRVANAIGCERLVIEAQVSNAATGSRWLIASEDNHFIATLDTPLAAAMGIDRDFEFQLLTRLRKHAFAPVPLYRDVTLTVLSFLDGHNPDTTFAQDHDQLSKLASTLGKVHALDPAFADAFVHTGFEARLEKYAEIAASQAADSLLGELKERARDCSPLAVALCHNDAHAGNILVAPGLSLIDWDYAGAGPVWFDLASTIAGSGLDSASATHFLNAYFGSESQWSQAELAAWLEIRSLVERLWQLCVASQIRKT
jgi:thiamine kinase-like enzyme